MTFLFKTDTTMKPYNRDKWWIDSDIVRPIRIEAESLEAALKKYVKHCSDCGIEVSKSALKNKEAMYRDTLDGTEQVGYVLTGKTAFTYEEDCKYKLVEQYIDLWVGIDELVNCFA